MNNICLYSDYSDVIVVGAGVDAVDYKLISICHKDDVVVSQDYGVAAMALGKGAHAIHQSGKWYTNENIDQMLMERHLNKKARRGSHKNHIKGQKKRTEEDDKRFAQSFEKLVLMEPVIKASICNGEQVAGFKDIHTGKIEEVMLIKSPSDLEKFKTMYGINEEITKEY
ncbi:MAG: DUF188 domain-containing protein [Lachnospira sp.]